MKRLLAFWMVPLLVGSAPLARAQDKAATEAIDKAIEALGGAAKLAPITAMEIKTKGKLSFNDNEGQVKLTTTMNGLEQYRGEFQGQFDDNDVTGVTVYSGGKGWRQFGQDTTDLDDDALANEKRMVYLQMVPILPNLLKGKGFKVELAGEEPVGGKPATVLKITGPDSKDFKLFLDKETGLPARQVATVAGWQGESYTQDTKFTQYKELGGIKKATRLTTTRDGEPFLSLEVTGFKPLDKLDPALFREP